MMSEINVLLSKHQAGVLEGSIEKCIVAAYDDDFSATATSAAEELAELYERIKKLEDNDTKLHMQFGQYIIANNELALLNATQRERIAELENQLEDAAEIIMGEDA